MAIINLWRLNKNKAFFFKWRIFCYYVISSHTKYISHFYKNINLYYWNNEIIKIETIIKKDKVWKKIINKFLIYLWYIDFLNLLNNYIINFLLNISLHLILIYFKFNVD